MIVFTIFIAATVLGLLFTYFEIPVIKRLQFGQYIREDGPQSHLKKQGTPTMGGIGIYAAVVVTAAAGSLLLGMSGSSEIWVIMLVGLLYGVIGFTDDYIKVAARHNLGLRAWQKLVLQIATGLAFGIYIMKFTPAGGNVWVPFVNMEVDLGIFFPVFVTFTMAAMSNSVNLSDGMDGLCGGISAIFALFFAWILDTPQFKSSSLYMLAVAGACLGFLFFNRYPAKIFMGDTGSMALGGGMTAAIMLTGKELLIPIAGFVFVAEALSVIIQVISFKFTGKRVFRMAPLHHHFEEGGTKETAVVKGFWLATVLCCALTYAILSA